MKKISHLFRDGRHDMWRGITAEEAVRVREAGFECIEIKAAVSAAIDSIAAQMANGMEVKDV